MEPQQNEVESVMAPLQKVTPVSKYLAMLLFVLLPFVGGYVGYQLAPEKVVEKILYEEKITESTFTKQEIEDLYYEYGGIKLVPISPVIVLTGTIQVSELFDDQFIIELQDDSVALLRETINVEKVSKYVMFAKSHPLIVAAAVQTGDVIQFSITDLYLDTRGIETHNSGALVAVKVLPI